MKKSILILLIIVAVAALVFSSCSKTTTTAPATTPAATTATTPATAPPTTATSAKTLNVGSTVPMNVPLGIEANKIFSVLIDDFNKSGGLVIKGQKYNVNLIIYDDKYTAEGGKTAAERLVNQDKVQYIVGTPATNSTVGVYPVTEAAKVLFINGAASEKVRDPALKYTICGDITLVNQVLWTYIANNYPSLKTWVHLAPDSDFGRSRAGAFDQIAKAFNINIVKHIYAPPDTQDFSSVVASIISLNPDGICTDGWSGGADQGLISKSLYQAGWKKPVASPLFNQADVEAVSGKPALEGFLTVYNDSTLWPNPPAQAVKLRQLYEAKYGAWNFYGARCANNFYLFFTAMQKADSIEVQDIMTTMKKGLTWNGFNGQLMLIKRPDLGNNTYIDVLANSCIGEYHDGKLVPKGVISPEEEVKGLEKILGYPGQWQ
jgi:branched-chain amino acid transport system substrate-binding protein